MNQIKKNIIEYGRKISEIGFSAGSSPRILVQHGVQVYATLPGADLAKLTESDIANIASSADSMKGALIRSETFQAMVVSQPAYASMCIEEGLSLPAVLDDMAMIVGPKVEIVPPDRQSIARALRKASAVMTSNGDLITCGRNLYEAVTCLFILEKNAEIFIDADFLGGANPVLRIPAMLEHQIYQNKYSRAEIAKQTAAESAGVNGITEQTTQSAESKSADSLENAEILKQAAAESESYRNTGTAKLPPKFAESEIADSAKASFRPVSASPNKKGIHSGTSHPASQGDGSVRSNVPVSQKDSALRKDNPGSQYGSTRNNILNSQNDSFPQNDTPVPKANDSVWSDAERQAREQIAAYGKKLVQSGLVQGTWGNLSIRLDDHWMLCTPSGLGYEGMTPEDIVRVDIDTLVYDGSRKPTSEKDFHAGIYRSRPEVNSIIHTHSKFACVFAACELSFHTSSGDVIECAKYGLSGTKWLSRNVQKALGNNKGCLMSHHGMIAVGEDIETAFHNAKSIENAAKEYIRKCWE